MERWAKPFVSGKAHFLFLRVLASPKLGIRKSPSHLPMIGREPQITMTVRCEQALLMVFRASANFHAWYCCYPFKDRKGNAPSNPLALSRLLTTPENVLGIANYRRPSSPRRGSTALPGDQNAHLRLSSDCLYYITFSHVWEALCDCAHGCVFTFSKLLV